MLALLLLFANWPQFRGPEAQGIGDGAPPVRWKAPKWKTATAGLSHSSPVIWGDRLFVATAVSAAGDAPLKIGLYGAGDSANDDAEQSWKIYCLDKRTGRLLWERTAHRGVPKARRHTKATHANTTVATDGKRLAAFFGSEGLFVYDLDGRLLWKKDFGVLDAGPMPDDLAWGFASSPVLFDDTVVIQCDVKKDPFVAALSAADGREIWRTSRAGLGERSWATPAVVRSGATTQVVTNGWPYIAGYDFTTGKELWRLRSGGDVPVPTPVFALGLIFVTNAHGGAAPLHAIKPEARGDISLAGDARSNAGIAWSEPRNGAYMQTPLIHDGLVYSCSDRGVLKVFDARTGSMKYQQRLGDGSTGFTASPVMANGRVYFTSEEGEVFVVKAGPVFELLATNPLGETCLSSPAVSDGRLFFRTRRSVIAIE